ncbi:MAG TPA: hypothetical protein HA362_02180 [Nanoarchaeota archaeon]|nr:hypothetical protein [Nanoarchaeota archaeon]
MWKFLRSLFEAREEKAKVDFFELEKFIAERMWKDARQDAEALNNARQKLEEGLEKLQQKSIDDAKVQERIKDVVKGNRNAFAITLRILLQQTAPPASYSTKSVIEFCRRFNEAMEDFNKKTIRNYFIMKNLIGEELEEIRKGLKETETIARRMQKNAEKGEMALLEDIQKRLADIYRHLEEKEERESRLELLEKKAKDLLEKEKEATEAIEKLKDSPEFTELAKDKAGLQEAMKELEAVKNRLRSEFSEVSRPLKKFEKAYPSRMISEYVEGPVEAIRKDDALKMAGLLHSAAESLGKGEIESKNLEKETQKVQELGSRLGEMRSSMLAVEAKLDEFAEKIKRNRAEEERGLKIAALNAIEKELAETETAIEDMKERAIGKDIEAIKTDLKKAGFDAELENVPYE